jgi:hypothetical protein
MAVANSTASHLRPEDGLVSLSEVTGEEYVSRDATATGPA